MAVVMLRVGTSKWATGRRRGCVYSRHAVTWDLSPSSGMSIVRSSVRCFVGSFASFVRLCVTLLAVWMTKFDLAICCFIVRCFVVRRFVVRCFVRFLVTSLPRWRPSFVRFLLRCFMRSSLHLFVASFVRHFIRLLQTLFLSLFVYCCFRECAATMSSPPPSCLIRRSPARFRNRCTH